MIDAMKRKMVVTLAEAAKRKGCSATAIHYAIAEQRITALKSNKGRNLGVYLDTKFRRWQPGPAKNLKVQP